jgi:hypothetical protein
MKTVIVMYMPGHGGNFIQRLFGLSPEFMPILSRKMLRLLVNSWRPMPGSWPKLSSYYFHQILARHQTWQNFHRDTADFLDHIDYRLLNCIYNFEYNFIYSIHPLELQTKFQELDQTDYYYVDLDTQYDQWVDKEQQRLGFVVRPNESELFVQLKQRHQMHPISLTAMLEQSQDLFLTQYHKICTAMQITPVEDQAIMLWNNWLDTRFRIYH